MQQTSIINSCIRCPHKHCKQTPSGTLDICDFGVAFYNREGEIIKREERVTLRHISQNLRHELHKILQLIVADASRIDSSVSTKSIDLDNPASRIVGATVIIDQFIEKISGVNDFHPTKQSSTSAGTHKKAYLFSVLDKYAKVYSLIQNTRRAKELNIEIDCDDQAAISFGSSVIEYIISVMLDNIWKYSLTGSSPSVAVITNDNGFLDIVFSNTSAPITECDCIFEKGYQEEQKSEGFGYGLFWSTLLVSHYNELAEIEEHPLELNHSQSTQSKNEATQKFSLRNIRA